MCLQNSKVAVRWTEQSGQGGWVGGMKTEKYGSDHVEPYRTLEVLWVLLCDGEPLVGLKPRTDWPGLIVP